MVRNYRRKSGKGIFDSAIMERAAKEVVDNNGKLRTVARELQVDKETLRRYVKKYREAPVGKVVSFTPQLNHRQVRKWPFLSQNSSINIFFLLK